LQIIGQIHSCWANAKAAKQGGKANRSGKKKRQVKAGYKINFIINILCKNKNTRSFTIKF
jgi:hypothetical protein